MFISTVSTSDSPLRAEVAPTAIAKVNMPGITGTTASTPRRRPLGVQGGRSLLCGWVGIMAGGRLYQTAAPAAKRFYFAAHAGGRPTSSGPYTTA